MWLLLASTALGACYQDHALSAPGSDASVADGALDASSAICLPNGGYTTAARLDSTNPAGCVMPMVMPAMISIPPRFSDFAMMCPMPPMGGVMQTGPCTFAIDLMCPMMGASFELHGTVDAHIPAVTGRIAITIHEGGGMCTAVVLLGE